MIRFLFIATILSGCSSEIRNDEDKLIEEWTAMWNSYNLDEVDLLFTKDVTYFSSERSGLIMGLDKLKAHHKSFGFVSAGKKSETKLWLTDIYKKNMDGDVLVAAIWHFSRPENKTDQQGPVTFLISERTGKWLIHHAHFSNDPNPGVVN